MQRIPHAAHWGAFHALVENGRLVGVEPHPLDPAPSGILAAIPDWLDPSVRVLRPMVREGWLKDRRRDGRGSDRYVPVGWEEATQLVAGEIQRVRTEHGNDAIFAGSYGWTSAGRFHHAQSQLRRMMNLIGGYTGYVDTYSYGAGAVIARHVLGTADDYLGLGVTLDQVAEHTGLMLVFGALSPRTAQIESGGVTRHRLEGYLAEIKARGIRVVHVSPRRDDLPDGMNAEWWPIIPGTDAALLIGLAGEIVFAGRHDVDFLTRCCSGSEAYLAYLRGAGDGERKTAEWAARITGLPAQSIRALAEAIPDTRTFITLSWGLQRAVHGEQPWWAAIALAAITGQFGLPGGGIGLGIASTAGMGPEPVLTKSPAVPQGAKPNGAFIPVSRVTDLFEKPGHTFTYEGQTHTYPDIRLVYWAGGNPFHHHQDLARLERAWARPETVIVQEPFWTATAKRADIVLPASTSLERNDIAGGRRSEHLVAMRKVVEPVGEALGDYEILRRIASRLGVEAAFTEGLDEMGWIRRLYGEVREDARARFRHELPEFDAFWAMGYAELPKRKDYVHLAQFRRDPAAHPLKTESGRIVLGSRLLAEARYADCPPHASWIEPPEWLGAKGARAHPFHLLSTQPESRLHGQLDHGRVSLAGKVAGREPLLLSPADADRLGLAEGDTALVRNARGRCLAGVRRSAAIRPGVAVLPTGAWYQTIETADGPLDIAGNPNVLTLDVGSSAFSQGCSAHTCLVAIERYEGNAPRPGDLAHTSAAAE